MKKFLAFFSIALFAGVLFSCQKSDDQQSNPKKYAAVLPGKYQVKPEYGDLILKAAPAIGGNEFAVWKKNETAPGYSLVNGSEFLPGSDAALNWAVPGSNPIWFAAGSSIWCTYCPVLPLRFVTKTTVGNNVSAVSYIGFRDVTPNANSFPLSLKCKRVGDKVTINYDQLASLTGYRNFSVKVAYTKSIIDLDATIQKAPAYADDAWPLFEYSSTVPADKTFTNATNGIQTLYEGLDAKVTGTLTITLTVDNNQIVKTVDAAGLGHGLAIVLTTKKVGWYDSGNFNMSYDDIDVVTKYVEF